MNFQSVQYFVTVAEKHSFSKAAEELYVTQPAVSRQIAELENELGFALFHRSRKGVYLTEEGQACYPLAREIVYGCQQLFQLAETLKQNVGNTIRIGYPNMTVLNYLPERLERLKQEYPTTKVDLIQTPPVKESLMLLKSYRVDALITSETFIIQDDDVKSTLICPGRLAIILPEMHYLTSRKKIYFQDLTTESILIHKLDTDSNEYQRLMDDCLGAGLSLSQFQTYEKSDEIFMEVAVGHGVGLMPDVFLDGRIGSMKAVPLLDCPEHYGVVLVLRKGEVNPVLNRLLKL